MFFCFSTQEEKKLQVNTATELTIKHERHTTVVIACAAERSAFTCSQKEREREREKKKEKTGMHIVLKRHGADQNLLFLLPLVFLELEGR